MENTNTTMNNTVPENFEKIITDMTTDLTTTFPEFAYLWTKWTPNVLNLMTPEEKKQEIEYLYEYCKKFYADKFFDILYYNEEIFNEKEGKTAFFLPGVNFNILFHCNDVSEKTRKVMYPQIAVQIN